MDMKNQRETLVNANLSSRNKLERILIDLDLNYNKIEITIDDFFYIVKLDSLFNELDQLYVLLSPSENNKELLVLCPNVYVLKKGDSKLSVLTALNKANLKLAGGTVTLDDDGIVMYRRIERFDRTDSITKIKLLNIFNDIIASIIYTAKEIKEIRK